MTFSPPTAEQQIRFLHDLQRIFEEGDFSATYKFALLMALAEIAVEAGNDSGAPEAVSLYSIAGKFVELYWRQAAPYRVAEGTTGVLWQNRGTQAAIIRHVDSLHSSSQGNLSVARLSGEWNQAIRATATIIREMPLRHLQVVAGVQHQFLYGFPLTNGDKVELKAGVVYNLRRFKASSTNGRGLPGWITSEQTAAMHPSSEIRTTLRNSCSGRHGRTFHRWPICSLVFKPSDASTATLP